MNRVGEAAHIPLTGLEPKAENLSTVAHRVGDCCLEAALENAFRAVWPDSDAGENLDCDLSSSGIFSA